MPQMSPMWWLTLISMIIILIMIMWTIIFTQKTHNTKYNKSPQKIKKMNWKW